eukprot:3633953-Rhodomonas_salina.4
MFYSGVFPTQPREIAVSGLLLGQVHGKGHKTFLRGVGYIPTKTLPATRPTSLSILRGFMTQGQHFSAGV